MRQHALIINPWITDFKLYDEWMHPLGLYVLISLLKQNNWDVTFVNCLRRDSPRKAKRCSTGDFPWVELEKPPAYGTIPRKYKLYGIEECRLHRLLENARRPDMIFIGSGMTYWIDGLARTVDAVGGVLPGIPVVIGGIAARLMPELLAQRFPECIVVSHGILDAGQGLRTKHDLLADLKPIGADPSLLGGLHSCEHLYHGPVLTSLGCPLDCTYCASRLLQPSFRHRSVEVILDEIEYCIDTFGVRDFAFYDDALLYGPRRDLVDLFRRLCVKQGMVRLHTPNGLHLRPLTPALVELMREAGFVTLRFGYETGSQAHASDTCAKAGRKLLADRISLVKAAGFGSHAVGVYIMGGLPGQTVESMLDEMDYVGSLGIDVKPVFLSPVPGTPVFNTYASRFPGLQSDPLLHNDTVFVTMLEGWGGEAVRRVREKARAINRGRHREITVAGDGATGA